jgi:hypothetical protein
MAVVSVLVADHALVPVAFELWICTSIAAPAARPDRWYGLVTPDTTVQAPAPDGLDRRLNPVAPPCVPSTAGIVQVTVRVVPVPCASDAAFGVFGRYSGLGGGIACIMARGRFGVAGSVGYFDMFDAVPVALPACGDSFVVVQMLVKFSYLAARNILNH